jgi:uncharacterized cupin superfamily protein
VDEDPWRDNRKAPKWVQNQQIDIAVVPKRGDAGYLSPFDVVCAKRMRWRSGNPGTLTVFAVNLMRPPPGNRSSQRHWHSADDEFV